MAKVSKKTQLEKLQNEFNSLNREMEETGLLKSEVLTVGTGSEARTVTNVSYDTDSIGKLLEILEQARLLTTRKPRK